MDPRPKRLSNHFSDVRLVSLAKLRVAAEIHPKDARGPYVILQHGYDPEDTAMRAYDYLLGRAGWWLALHWFLRMPVDERHAEFFFGTKVEVIERLQNLLSEVRVIRGQVPIMDENEAMTGAAQGESLRPVASTSRWTT
jgi:hypothetical protein